MDKRRPCSVCDPAPEQKKRYVVGETNSNQLYIRPSSICYGFMYLGSLLCNYNSYLKEFHNFRWEDQWLVVLYQESYWTRLVLVLFLPTIFTLGSPEPFVHKEIQGQSAGILIYKAVDIYQKIRVDCLYSVTFKLRRLTKHTLEVLSLHFLPFKTPFWTWSPWSITASTRAFWILVGNL